MHHLFGRLRSLLHTLAPSPAAWRLIWRLIDRAPADYAAELLVPYADDMLQSWPDPLRIAPSQWLHSLATPSPHPGWPLVRALLIPHDLPHLDALLTRDHLAHITTLRADGRYQAAAPRFEQLLLAPNLHLKHLDAPHSPLSQDTLQHLLRRPTLETLRIGAWNHVFSAPLADLHLPSLRALDLSTQHLSRAQIEALLHRAHLPALSSLAINLRGDTPQETLRTAPLIAQLDRLAIHQTYTTQTCVATALLHALPADRALDHLTLHSVLGAQGSVEAMLSAPIKAPRHLTLDTLHIEHRQLDDLARWSGLVGVESLDLTRALNQNTTTLTPALIPALQAGLRDLSITTNSADDLSQLICATPMPHVESLTLEDVGLDAWPAPGPELLPALTALHLKTRHLHEGALDRLARQPFIPRLRHLTLGSVVHHIGPQDRATLNAALAGMTQLEHLDLRALVKDADTLDALTHAPMPALHTLLLGRITALTPAHIERLRHAPWLPQLTRLALTLPAGNKRNLRGELRRHGLPRLAKVSY